MSQYSNKKIPFQINPVLCREKDNYFTLKSYQFVVFSLSIEINYLFLIPSQSPGFFIFQTPKVKVCSQDSYWQNKYKKRIVQTPFLRTATKVTGSFIKNLSCCSWYETLLLSNILKASQLVCLESTIHSHPPHSKSTCYQNIHKQKK